MGKKDKRTKKLSARKEKYAKFHKEKGNLVFKAAELSDEERQEAREAETRLERFLKVNKNIPLKNIVARKDISKR